MGNFGGLGNLFNLFNNQNVSTTPTQNPPPVNIVQTAAIEFLNLFLSQNNQPSPSPAGLQAQAPTNPQIERAEAAAKEARRAAEEAQQSAQRVQQLAERQAAQATQAAQKLVLDGLNAGKQQQPVNFSTQPGRVTFLVDPRNPAGSLANGGVEHANNSLNNKVEKPRGGSAPKPMEPPQSTTQYASRPTAIEPMKGQRRVEATKAQLGNGVSEQKFVEQNQKSYERALQRRQAEQEAKREEALRARQTRIAKELRRDTMDYALVKNNRAIKDAHTEHRQKERDARTAEKENAIPSELREHLKRQQRIRDAEANRADLKLAKSEFEKDLSLGRTKGMSKQGANAFTERVVGSPDVQKALRNIASFAHTRGGGVGGR